VSLDQIKTDICEYLDKVWDELHGTTDVEQARAVAGALPAVIHKSACAAQAAVLNHVIENANQPAPTAEPVAAAAVTPPVETPVMPVEPVADQNPETVETPADETAETPAAEVLAPFVEPEPPHAPPAV
jgi:hypothetical protein